MSICLYASEVAIITGHNKYKKVSELITLIWQRYFQYDFKNTVQFIEENKNIKLVPIKDDNEIVKNITKKNNLNLEKEIKKCINSKDVTELDNNKKSIIKKVDDKKKENKKIIENFINNIDTIKTDKKKVESMKKKILKNFDNKKNKSEVKKILENLDELKNNKNNIIKKLENETKEEKKELKKNLDSLGNRNFGINHENQVLRLFEEKRGIRVMEDTKFYKRNLFSTESLKWMIGGRIDGITEDGTIIEIKNRIYRLFYRLRDYERIQIQTYMYIFRAENGVLVESRNGNINMIDVEFNEAKYENIINKIKNFANFFNNFIGDLNMKRTLLIGTEEEKDNLYIV